MKDEKKLKAIQEETKKEVKTGEQNGVKLDDKQMEQVTGAGNGHTIKEPGFLDC